MDQRKIKAVKHYFNVRAVILHFLDCEHPLSANDLIRDVLDMSRANALLLLHSLEEEGLIIKVNDNPRNHIFAITQKGKELYGNVMRTGYADLSKVIQRVDVIKYESNIVRVSIKHTGNYLFKLNDYEEITLMPNTKCKVENNLFTLTYQDTEYTFKGYNLKEANI